MLTSFLHRQVHTQHVHVSTNIYPHIHHTHEENINIYTIQILFMKEHERYKHTTETKLEGVMKEKLPSYDN